MCWCFIASLTVREDGICAQRRYTRDSLRACTPPLRPLEATAWARLDAVTNSMDPTDVHTAGLAHRVTTALQRRGALRRQPTTRYDEVSKQVTEAADEAIHALEAITQKASKAFSLQAYIDKGMESAGAVTYRGLSQVSETAAKSFVEFGLWTRGHGLGSGTIGNLSRYATLGALCTSCAFLAYKLGAADALFKRWLKRKLSASLGTRVSVKSVQLSLSGRLEVKGIRVDDWDGRRQSALRVGSVEAIIGMRSIVAWFLSRRDEPPPPVVFVDPRFAEVTLRLRREPDGLFNWASANARVRDARKAASSAPGRRLAITQELSDASVATSSDSESGTLARYLLPLDASSSSSDGISNAASDAYGARWWRRRDVALFAERCGASKRATRVALERSSARGHRRSPSLTRAERRAANRADAFESWCAQRPRDVLRDVAVQLRRDLAYGSTENVRENDTRPTTKPTSKRRFPNRARLPLGLRFVAVRVDLYDCPVLVDACAVGPDELILDDDVLTAYSIYSPSLDDAGSFSPGDVGAALSEKLLEAVVVDTPDVARTLSGALARDLVARDARRALKRTFLNETRAERRRRRRARRQSRRTFWRGEERGALQ